MGGLSAVTFQPHVEAWVGITGAGCLEAFLEVKAEMALEGTLLPWIDPYLDANDDGVSV